MTGTSNQKIGPVMQKAGMKFEGTLADEVFKDGQFHNLHIYGIINSERCANVSIG